MNHSKIPDPLQNIADLLLDAVFMVDARGNIVYVSAACERIFGYTPDEMTGKAIIDFVAPEDRASTWAESMQVMAGHQRIGFENRYIRKDGCQVHVMWSARWSEDGQMRIGVARDVTERKHAEAQQAATYAISEAAHAASDLVALYRETHGIIAKLVPTASFAVGHRDHETGKISFPYQMDTHGDSSLVNETVARQLCEDVIVNSQSLVIPVQPSANSCGAALSTNFPESWLGVPLVSQNGAMGALIMKSHPGMFYSEKDKELLQFVSTQLATAIERKQLHAELLRMAQYDELTGLPNRRLLYDRMTLAFARTRREHKRAAILFIDLDNFKLVNDSLGHSSGDLVLKEVARRLKQCVRDEDTVARLGGDEFVVLLEHVQFSEDVSVIAEKIKSAVCQKMRIDRNVLQAIPSIGIALYPDHGTTVEQVMQHADAAMYAEKKNKIHRPESVSH